MVSVVADTHAIVWHLTDPHRLARGARRAFAAIDAGRWLCLIPVIVLVEIWLLHERSRLRLGPAQFLDAIAGHPGYAVLSLDTAQPMEFGTLPRVRRSRRLLVRRGGEETIGYASFLMNHSAASSAFLTILR